MAAALAELAPDGARRNALGAAETELEAYQRAIQTARESGDSTAWECKPTGISSSAFSPPPARIT